MKKLRRFLSYLSLFALAAVFARAADPSFDQWADGFAAQWVRTNPQLADAFRDDPAEARRLLADAGFPGGQGFPHVEVVFCDRLQTRLVLEVAQEMWRKQLGIEVRLAKQEWSVYINTEKTGQYHLADDSWAYRYPQGYFELHGTGSPISYYLWSSADYDRLLRIASAAASIPERNAFYAQLEAILAREMPAIPLYFNVATYLKHPAVRGWSASPDYDTSWKQVWLEK